MLRRATATAGLAALLLIPACGRQITPNPTTSNLAGDIDLRFRVNGTLAYSTYDYQIVIDTCGQGVPLPNPATNSYKKYTFSFNVGTSPFGVATVYPILEQYKLTTGTTGFIPIPVPLSPSLVSLNTNSNGQGSEFELIFPRAQLEDPLGAMNLPCTEATSATPAATTSPIPEPTTASEENWIFNFIVLTPAGVPLDSLGQGGASDTSFGGIVVNTQSLQPNLVVKTADSSGAPSDPNASIAGGEIDNYP